MIPPERHLGRMPPCIWLQTIALPGAAKHAEEQETSSSKHCSARLTVSSAHSRELLTEFPFFIVALVVQFTEVPSVVVSVVSRE